MLLIYPPVGKKIVKLTTIKKKKKSEKVDLVWGGALVHTHTCVHAYTLSFIHRARGKFSITATAKQSPGKDVPCLSGTAFPTRFLFLNFCLSRL